MLQQERAFSRIYFGRYPNPLGFGKGKSRFSDPRRRKPEGLFGVLYLGASLKACFVEAVLRDHRNGLVSDYPIDEIELRSRMYAEIEVAQELRLIDLRGDGPIRMGIPSDVTGAARQHRAREWSVAFYEHPAQPDGIIYPSRLNRETNLAIYDRATSHLRVKHASSLLEADVLPDVLDELKVAVA